MGKIILKPTGGLNKDTDPNELPEGDYAEATNIIMDPGKNGGGNAIRLLESIKTSGISFSSGTIKATFLSSSGSIYVIVDNTSTASIWEINSALSAKVELVRYTLPSTPTVVPDIRAINSGADAMIVWNYYGDGTLLSFVASRYYTPATTQVYSSISDLTLQKQTPNNVVSIAKVLSSTPTSVLEENDFQFASRYQYDSGEYSVLSNYSQIYKGTKGVAQYDLTYDFTGAPAIATSLEVFVRFGNTGSWRRIDTALKSATTFTWKGQVFETLDSVTAAKPFDAVPVNAKHVEVAKNRVFLGNIEDDYSVASTALDFTIGIGGGNGYVPASGSDYKTYLPVGTVTTASINSDEIAATAYRKPFANNSRYAFAVAYYDQAMKTRGVETKSITNFKTGRFTYPIIPDVTVALNAGWAAPSWAVYAQLLYTKNLEKANIYEGYASNIYFEIKKQETNPVTNAVSDVITISQSVTASDLKFVNAMVVDLMGMFRAGGVYTFQQGDRITIKTPIASPADGILDLRIIGQKDSLLYCEYVGIEMTNIAIPDPSLLYFEIYTPKQAPEDENLLFYEYGSLMPLSGWSAGSTVTISADGALNTNKLLGDMVFVKFELPVYSEAPFLYNVVKDPTATVVEDVVTVMNASMAAGGQNLQSSLTGQGVASPVVRVPAFTSIPTNGDGATIVDGAIKFNNFYEVGKQDATTNKMVVTYSLTLTKTLTLVSGEMGAASYRLKSQIWKTPFNAKTNKYDLPAEKIGTSIVLASNDLTQDITGGTEDFSITQDVNLNTGLTKDINAGDKIHIELILDFTTTTGVTAAVVNFTKQAATDGISINFNGDKTPSKTITTYNPDAAISATKQKFVVRGISTAKVNQQWNTSAGKPFLEAKSTISSRRTNAIRYSGVYVAGTKINNTSSFFALDSNEVPIENGPINSLLRASRIQGSGDMLLALCEKETSYILLGEQELTQGNNASLRSLTMNMIGTIRNLGDRIGLSDKKSVYNYKGTIYWWDNFNKKVVEFTEKGVQTISDFRMRSHFLSKSGVAAICYDPFYDMLFVSIGSDTTSDGFSVNARRWRASYAFKPEFAEHYGDRMLIFKSNVLYRSLENGTQNDYNSFLGASAVDGTIQIYANTKLPVLPLNICVWHNMNVINWSNANGVKSSLMTINIANENGQSTNIVESNFLMEDNKLYAHVLRDVNTAIVSDPIVNGNFMVGYLNKFTLTLKDKTQNMRINAIDVEALL